jgi:hypothetical protein
MTSNHHTTMDVVDSIREMISVIMIVMELINQQVVDFIVTSLIINKMTILVEIVVIVR